MALRYKSADSDLSPVAVEKDITTASVVPVDLDVFDDKDVTTARHLFKYEDGERLKRKADIRLLSILACCYLLKNIDQQLISVSPPSAFHALVGIC